MAENTTIYLYTDGTASATRWDDNTTTHDYEFFEMNANKYFSKHFGVDWYNNTFYSSQGIRIIVNQYPL